MKRFVYLILISTSSFLTLLNAKNYSEEYSDLIRILFLEKSAFEELSFSPFPLIATMNYLFLLSLSVLFLSSRSAALEKSLFLHRFSSCGRYLGYLCLKTSGNILFCVLGMTLTPPLLAVIFSGRVDFDLQLSLLLLQYAVRQVLLLHFAFAVSLVSPAALGRYLPDIIGILFLMLLIMADVFLKIPAALPEIQMPHIPVIFAEVLLLTLFWAGYEKYFKRKGEKL